MMADAVGLIISISSLKLSKRPVRAGDKYTFGFVRFEVVGALGSLLTIWTVTVLLLREAIDRILHPQVGAPRGLLFRAARGPTTRTPKRRWWTAS